MNKYLPILLWMFICLMVSCGPKEASKLCSGAERKEYSDDILKATIEEGCVIKYTNANSYKIDGNSTFKIMGDASVKKSIALTKGKLIASNGEYVLKSAVTYMKIRMLSGDGAVEYDGKLVPLKANNVLEIGKE
jgi:hypothetical protein